MQATEVKLNAQEEERKKEICILWISNRCTFHEEEAIYVQNFLVVCHFHIDYYFEGSMDEL
jgi:hypothetical protein